MRIAWGDCWDEALLDTKSGGPCQGRNNDRNRAKWTRPVGDPSGGWMLTERQDPVRPQGMKISETTSAQAKSIALLRGAASATAAASGLVATIAFNAKT
jgi:hypothetical protein